MVSTWEGVGVAHQRVEEKLLVYGMYRSLTVFIGGIAERAARTSNFFWSKRPSNVNAVDAWRENGGEIVKILQ